MLHILCENWSFHIRYNILNTRYHISSKHIAKRQRHGSFRYRNITRSRVLAKQLKYVRNYTSVSTEGIKVLSRDRQVGRRDIRSLAAAAIPLFPFLVESFLLFPASLSFLRQRNFLSIRTYSEAVYSYTIASLHALIYWTFRNFQCKRKQVLQWRYSKFFRFYVPANLSSSKIDSKELQFARQQLWINLGATTAGIRELCIEIPPGVAILSFLSSGTGFFMELASNQKPPFAMRMCTIWQEHWEDGFIQAGSSHNGIPNTMDTDREKSRFSSSCFAERSTDMY